MSDRQNAVWTLAESVLFTKISHKNPTEYHITQVVEFLDVKGVHMERASIPELLKETHAYSRREELHERYRIGCL